MHSFTQPCASSGDGSTALSPQARWALWLVALALALVWFGSLDARHLLRSDEGRYAEIAREMWQSGDWVTPRYNGLKYFEKPPLHMWMTALAFQLWGLGEWQARLWVAISGAFGILMMALAAGRWWGPRVALFSALILVSTPNWFIGAHFNSLDMSVSGALAAVLACALIAQHPAATARQRLGWMLGAWAAMGVAVLTKGLIGVALPGLVLVVYTLWTRDWALWRRLHLVGGTLVLLLVTVPWFWLVSQRNPEFPQFFFIHEHFQRYTSTIHHRNAPFWFFVPQLLAGFLPWLGLLPGMWTACRAEAPRPNGFRPLHLLATWAVAIFVFFSASGSKLPGYILPVMPALTVWAAVALDRWQPRTWARYTLGALLVFALLAVTLPLVATYGRDDAINPALRAYVYWIVAAAVVMALGSALAWALQRHGRHLFSVVSYAVAMVLGVNLVVLGHENLGRGISGIDLVPAVRAALKPGMPFYGVRELDHTLPFYLRHTLTMVEQPDELAFGVAQEPQKWLPTLAAFQSRWRDGTPAMALMSPETFQQLASDNLPMYLVARDARRVVVANFDPPRP